MGEIFNRKELTSKRKKLRNNSTSAEIVLWTNLNKSQLDGRKFRRQHSIGNFIVDFYCPKEELIVELDGEGHLTPEGIKYDVQRRNYFQSLGLKEIRFENEDVLYNLQDVLSKIRQCFAKH